jgi:hypothetical protein
MNSKREGAEMTKTFTPAQEWQIEHYMSKGFDRETAEALTFLNDNGTRSI